MQDKIVMVTGSTAGIGKATALEIARMGASVIVVGRNEEKTREAVSMIRRETGNDNVDYLLADLSSIDQVITLADQFKAKHDRLDVLVNNVGAFLWSRQETDDGIEMTFALNHLVGYFLLTYLLLDVIQASPSARIVNVSSAAHFGGKIDFEDLEGRLRYTGWKAYGQSKLADVMFTYALARRLVRTGVTVNALHPGVVASNFAVTNNRNTVLTRLFRVVTNLFSISEAEGAETSVYLATSPEVEGVTGRYFDDKQEKRSSKASYDQAAQERLWQVSEEMLATRSPALGLLPVDDSSAEMAPFVWKLMPAYALQ